MWYNKSFKCRFLVLNVQDNLNAKKLRREIGCQNIINRQKKKKKKKCTQIEGIFIQI